jgi:hypothetical protein
VVTPVYCAKTRNIFARSLFFSHAAVGADVDDFDTLGEALGGNLLSGGPIAVPAVPGETARYQIFGINRANGRGRSSGVWD